VPRPSAGIFLWSGPKVKINSRDETAPHTPPKALLEPVPAVARFFRLRFIYPFCDISG
jgi:hypothetical protein